MSASAVDMKITTLEEKKVYELSNVSIVCDGRDLGGMIEVEQGGAKVSISLGSVQILRTLQYSTGFYVKTQSGHEFKNVKLPCQSYQFVGSNPFGGKTEVDGKVWHLVRIQG